MELNVDETIYYYWSNYSLKISNSEILLVLDIYNFNSRTSISLNGRRDSNFIGPRSKNVEQTMLQLRQWLTRHVLLRNAIVGTSDIRAF